MEQSARFHDLNSVDIWQTKYVQLVAMCLQSLDWKTIIKLNRLGHDFDIYQKQNPVDNQFN